MTQTTDFSRSAMLQENFISFAKQLGSKKRKTGERTKWFQENKPYVDIFHINLPYYGPTNKVLNKETNE